MDVFTVRAYNWDSFVAAPIQYAYAIEPLDIEIGPISSIYKYIIY